MNRDRDRLVEAVLEALRARRPYEAESFLDGDAQASVDAVLAQLRKDVAEQIAETLRTKIGGYRASPTDADTDGRIIRDAILSSETP